MAKSDRERELELAVLGGKDEFLAHISAAPEEDEEPESDSDDAPEEVGAKEGPVWADPDDLSRIAVGSGRRHAFLQRSTDKGKTVVSGTEYSGRLRRELERTQGATPAWALPKAAKKARNDASDSEQEEISEAMLRSTGACLAASTRALPQGCLRFKRLTDPTFGHRMRKPLSSVEFHPSAPLLLVAGEAQKVQLFKSEGEKWELGSSVAFESFPVNCGGFVAGAVAVSSPRHSHFFLHHLDSRITNKSHVLQKGTKKLGVSGFVASPDGGHIVFLCAGGSLHVVSGSGDGWLGELRLNGAVRAAAFARGNSERLFAVGEEGLVYVWELSSRRCVHKFADEGCLQGTALALSNDGRHIAVGSSSGIVNVYETASALKSGQPKPLFSIANLVTRIDCLRFNSTAELLLIASSRKPAAVRLVHVRSGSVYDNFPGKRAKTRCVTTAAFSPDSALLCLGNDQKLHEYLLPDKANATQLQIFFSEADEANSTDIQLH